MKLACAAFLLATVATAQEYNSDIRELASQVRADIAAENKHRPLVLPFIGYGHANTEEYLAEELALALPARTFAEYLVNDEGDDERSSLPPFERRITRSMVEHPPRISRDLTIAPEEAKRVALTYADVIVTGSFISDRKRNVTVTYVLIDPRTGTTLRTNSATFSDHRHPSYYSEETKRPFLALPAIRPPAIYPSGFIDAQRTTAARFIDLLLSGPVELSTAAIVDDNRHRIIAQVAALRKSIERALGRYLEAIENNAVSRETARRVPLQLVDLCGRSTHLTALLGNDAKVIDLSLAENSCSGDLIVTDREAGSPFQASKEDQRFVHSLDLVLSRPTAGDETRIPVSYPLFRTPLFSYCRLTAVKVCEITPLDITHVGIWGRFANGEALFDVLLNDRKLVESASYVTHPYPTEQEIEDFRTRLHENLAHTGEEFHKIEKDLPAFQTTDGTVVTPSHDANGAISAAKSALLQAVTISNGSPLHAAAVAFADSRMPMPEARRAFVRMADGQLQEMEVVKHSAVHEVLDNIRAWGAKVLTAPDVAPTISVTSQPSGGIFEIADTTDPSFARAPLRTNGQLKYVWLGRYSCKLTKEGYATATMLLDLTNDPRTHISCELHKAEANASSSCWTTEQSAK